MSHNAGMAVTFERIGSLEGDRAMIRPQLTGISDDGLPFMIAADSAVQIGASAEQVRLVNVRAELTLKDGTALNFAAPEGVIDTRAQALDLSGGIRFGETDGYSAETAAARADLKAGIVHGESPVQAQSALGTLTADGFTFDKNTHRLRFDGSVHMLVYGVSQ
jgi:hypothetical protein